MTNIMVPKFKKVLSKTNNVLHKTTKVGFRAKNTQKRILKNVSSELTIATSQTLKIKRGEITIDDKQLKNSSTKRSFFSKYEFREVLKEGGNGAVFKGKYKNFKFLEILHFDIKSI